MIYSDLFWTALLAPSPTLEQDIPSAGGTNIKRSTKKTTKLEIPHTSIMFVVFDTVCMSKLK